MSKTLLMLVGDYAELRNHGAVPDAAGGRLCGACRVPGQEAGESVATAIHDFEGAQTYSEARP